MQDLLVFVLIGGAVAYLGWKWFGKSGSSCGCGCDCPGAGGDKKSCCSENKKIDDQRQK
ncbi:FeoB-associated Cys-rich membrane protein [Maridesulfovibrio hydrothermalis]|uniref:FeoB-associated Cys-rich membrane protein n=1 Tax=Maridesulfovibrio hydrothermalis TaxID=191026 RepID=UPI0012B67094|nr:FeoB-associated Cys-rich membrane protein [Maridesulfovibrio hydrothermalis]